ncbi:predicted protein [Streptomyces viridosporus ATCC 14672]|uniref:Predicted protein n=1 Tax=Streptomyces viridosporus (strain ATCC 14672 / DSM 40746 / JCM 4963 / KCTC 9882 / NRRL B-12104 / FH 1290) TaxID=566461 RepID=D5ZR11_STRV1|nr:predicted protein [Streptomyces viridosporus ATCC 14672]
MLPSGGSGARGGLCHVHQSNRPQVRDAKLSRPLLRGSGCGLVHAARSDLDPTGEVFLLHSRWTVNVQVRRVLWSALRSCSQGCPPGRAQVSRVSPQHWGGRPQGLWITRLADGADGPTVVRRSLRPPTSKTPAKPARGNRS